MVRTGKAHSTTEIALGWREQQRVLGETDPSGPGGDCAMANECWPSSQGTPMLNAGWASHSWDVEEREALSQMRVTAWTAIQNLKCVSGARLEETNRRRDL